MKNWKTKKALYEIRETGKGINETYFLYRTGKEIANYCKAKYEMNGYINGLGGDRTYTCVAIELTA